MLTVLRARAPAAPALARATDTLAAGHNLWLIGPFQFTGEPPEKLPKPPTGPAGWWEVPYELGYARQFEFLAVTRARELVPMSEAAPAGINPYENLPLFRARGWKPEPEK